jgi:hypothetical protein
LTNVSREVPRCATSTHNLAFYSPPLGSQLSCDALGLRALSDQFADAVAPGLSNRVRDGRWVTILAWCLARSHAVFHASGRRSVATRTLQRERYGWLRPLELMWVARTISLTEDWQNRSLAGQRRVRPWYEDDDQSKDRFGMTAKGLRPGEMFPQNLRVKWKPGDPPNYPTKQGKYPSWTTARKRVAISQALAGQPLQADPIQPHRGTVPIDHIDGQRFDLPDPHRSGNLWITDSWLEHAFFDEFAKGSDIFGNVWRGLGR